MLSRKTLRHVAIAALLAVSSGYVAAAQQKLPVITPEVQRLYAEARDAQSRGDTQTAIARYTEILRQAPRLAPAYNNLGMLYYNASDFARAAEVLRKGLAVDAHMVTAQTLLGLSDYRLAHYSEAKAELTRALTADPGNSDAELALAQTEIATSDAAAATVHLREYLVRQPRDQQAWYLLGKTYLQLSQASLAKVNEIDPNSTTAHLITGEIDESMHNYDGAMAEYTKAAAQSPRQPGVHYHLGNAYWLEEKFDSAEAEFRAELQVDPANCITQWKLGNSVLAANGDPTTAITPLDAAISACPTLMQAHVDRANALLKLNEPQKALLDLRPAAQATPDEPSIHFLLSRTYKALGDSDQARSELELYGKLQRQAAEATANQAKDVLSAKERAH